MIENVIILLVANTVIPWLPVPAPLLLPAPLALPLLEEPSAFHNMNLTRLYSPEQAKQQFREAQKVHHPDRGGRVEVFQQIQGLKKLFNEPVNYYDLYNVTNADLTGEGGLKLADVVTIKSTTFYVELGIFYFIALLYVLAFTLDEEGQPARKYMVLLVLAALGYEYYIHEHPHQPTLIDFISPYLPLFTQRNLIKRSLALFLAVIRSYFYRRKTEEQTLTLTLQQPHTMPEYKEILERLNQIYEGKVAEKERYDRSIWAKLRGWISKAISAIFLLLIAKSVIGL